MAHSVHVKLSTQLTVTSLSFAMCQRLLCVNVCYVSTFAMCQRLLCVNVCYVSTFAMCQRLLCVNVCYVSTHINSWHKVVTHTALIYRRVNYSRKHTPSSSSVLPGHSLQLYDLPLTTCSVGVRSVQFVPSVQGLSWQPSKSISQ